jgi:putative transposase
MRPTHAGYYHVTSRSIAEEHIFRDNRDYHAGIQILAELASANFFACLGFCLMPTHYHLFAWFDEEMLTGTIHLLNRRYAGGFNRRHSRRGHVFDSPFTAIPVEDDVHFRWLDEYIANNPPERPWPWSSYDAHFSFVETREPGAALPNQVRSA